jgi:cytochrome c-type biogenesis protein CcmH/NrfG
VLFVLGHLRAVQGRPGDAVDALSLSAKLNPEKPETFYFLGLALVEKGQRQAAETALRRAIQLKPNWGQAHYQMAFVYATQQPPFKELAQWHYQKARDGGAPRNPELEKLIEGKKSASVNR